MNKHRICSDFKCLSVKHSLSIVDKRQGHKQHRPPQTLWGLFFLPSLLPHKCTSWPCNRAGNNYSFKWTCQVCRQTGPAPPPHTHRSLTYSMRQEAHLATMQTPTHTCTNTISAHTHTSCCSVGEIHQRPSRQTGCIRYRCSKLVHTIHLPCISSHTHTCTHTHRSDPVFMMGKASVL